MISGSTLKSFFFKNLMGCISICCFLSCKNNLKEVNEIVQLQNSLQEDKATDVTIFYSKNAHVDAQLFTHEFVRNESAKPPYTDMRKGLKVTFYNDSMQIKSTLTARYARYFEQAQNILVKDSIVVLNQKGEKLETEELLWNQNTQKFSTDKFVKITTANQIIMGMGMEANQDFTWYLIKNPSGIVQVNKPKM